MNDELLLRTHALLMGVPVELVYGSWRFAENIHGLVLANSDGVIASYHNGSLIAREGRGEGSITVEKIVELLDLDPEIKTQARAVHPADFTICGPLTIAAYRATWLPELDAQGQRVRREPNEQAGAQTTTVVEP